MAQAFVTTYRYNFRSPKEPLGKSRKPLERHAASAPPGDCWIDIGVEKHKKDLHIPYAQALVDQSFRRLMFSTYQMNYCTDKMKEICKEMREAVQKAAGEENTQQEEQSFENELLQYCRELYSQKSTKILPPISTSRRVHGYIRPEAMYTPLTNYQMVYGKAGYEIMSNPLQYLKNQGLDEDRSNPSSCVGNEVNTNNNRTAFKHCVDIRRERIQKE